MTKHFIEIIKHISVEKSGPSFPIELLLPIVWSVGSSFLSDTAVCETGWPGSWLVSLARRTVDNGKVTVAD